MTLANASLIVTILLFTIYAWMSTVEFAVALARFQKQSSKKASPILTYFTPMMEVTNVFMVFGFTAYAILFNRALVQTSELVFPSLVIGLVALLVRACLIIELYYHRPRSGPTFTNGLFVASSAVVPLTVAAAGITVMTGTAFWNTSSGWLLMLTAIFSLFAGGLSCKATLEKRPSSQTASGAYPGLLMSGFGIAAVIQLHYDFPQMRNLTLSFLALGLGLGLLVHAAAAWHRHPSWSWHHITAAIIMFPIFLAAANSPQLIYGQVSIEEAYGAQAYGLAGFIGLAIMLPIMGLGLGLLAALAGKDSKEH